MPGIAIVAVVGVGFFLGYKYYSTYLAGPRVYALDPAYVTPAHQFRDGVDFLPTNKHVLFGHHFTSVAGAAPIVGPAIAVFWGWVPALLWVVLGTIFASGAHDFGSIVVSVRNRARNIGTLTADVINRRSRTLFLLIIFFLVTLVNAVFAIVIANLFIGFPGAVIPIFFEIPLAIAVGQYIYRKQTPALGPSIVGVALLYLSIPIGARYPISIAGWAEAIGWDERTLWIVIMFTYAFIASRLPVWILLQPRDYINSHQLFIALFIVFMGLLVGFNEIVAPAINSPLPEGTPNWFPFLFITIACGAISGFHSLVAYGTTTKQIDKETDARYVGYMGSMGEGSLAVASIMATTAGIAIVGMNWQDQYADFPTASAGAVGNFVNGVAGFAGNLGVPEAWGLVFAAVVVVSFAATTLDTGVRLQRYIIQEIGEIIRIPVLQRSIWLGTVLAVAFPLFLALAPGELAFGRLWLLFGTTNQLTAGLALSVIAVWVLRNNRNPIAQMVPLVFLLAMTTWALILNTRDFFADRDFFLGPLNVLIFLLAVWLIVEAMMALRRARELGIEEPEPESKRGPEPNETDPPFPRIGQS
jgi:carbon starvation protein